MPIWTRPLVRRAVSKGFKTIVVVLYGGVIALSVLFQGGNALYYFTRRRHVEDFVADTPEWVRDVLRSTSPAMSGLSRHPERSEGSTTRHDGFFATLRMTRTG